jgi:AraC-like DNA-binding protein
LELLHVFLEPAGARPLFGVPGSELASSAFELSELWGRQRSAELIERLATAASWQDRFDVLDDVFTRALRFVVPPAGSLRAWRALGTNAQISIDDLAREVGWSRQYLTGSFKAEFGVTPATARRIFRFEHACRLIKHARPRLADVAAACGYHDQAHMTHDWNALAGCTPTAWIATELPSLQDYELAGSDDDSQD